MLILFAIHFLKFNTVPWMLLAGFFAGDIMMQRHKNASYSVGGLKKEEKFQIRQQTNYIEVMSLYVAVFTFCFCVQKRR